MNVWILNHYADTPEGQLTRSYDFGRGLVRRGHRVTIFASGFSHHGLRERRLRPGEALRMEDVDGVRFVWLRTVPYHSNDIRRALNMLSYAWRALWVGLASDDVPDAIVGTSVHPLAPLAAHVLSRRKGSRFLYEVTDLWPETLVLFGVLSRGNPVTWVLRALEKSLSRRAERVISVLPRTDLYAESRGIPQEKVVWIPNGVDASRYNGLKPYAGGCGETFTIMYLGSLTASNALEVVLEAAHLLEGAGEFRCRFVFVGDGTERPSLVRRTRELALDSVEFRGLVPRNELFGVMGEADAFVSSQRRLALYKYGLSQNKMSEYLLSGRPVLHAGDPETSPVREAGAGIVVPPEDPAALAAAIRALVRMDPEERLQMGRNGRRYALERYDLGALVQQYERVLLGEA